MTSPKPPLAGEEEAAEKAAEEYASNCECDGYCGCKDAWLAGCRSQDEYVKALEAVADTARDLQNEIMQLGNANPTEHRNAIAALDSLKEAKGVRK